MRSNSQLKDAAIDALKGKWGKMALVTFIVFVVFTAASSIAALIDEAIGGEAFKGGGVLTIVVALLLLPLMWGFYAIFLHLYRKDGKDKIDNVFDGYKDFSRIFTTNLLQSIYQALWTLLLIVPGIIKGLSYAMTPYVLVDHPEMKNNAAIELSMKMMHGHKFDLFILLLSFIGWALLCCLTFGLGFFLLAPYINTTLAAFYEDLKADMTGKPVQPEPAVESTPAEPAAEDNAEDTAGLKPVD